MNLERVIFGFFIILTLSLNYAFVAGGVDTAAHRNVWILTLTIIVNLVAIGLKLGDRSQTGALLLASGLVAGLLLITARIVWIVAEPVGGGGPGPGEMADIVSIATGALVANIVATVILVGDTLLSRR
jgi:Ca2+/H+ antiporter, TMEM165/GDT1 family